MTVVGIEFTTETRISVAAVKADEEISASMNAHKVFREIDAGTLANSCISMFPRFLRV
jgi:predicted DCC family thiol-disulfide oxidoreductase YuxK